MIDKNNLKQVILEYVIDEYMENDGQISNETKLISSGLVDSFSMVSLKRFLEIEYEIEIPDDDASPENFDSVNSIADLVENFLSKTGK